MIFTVLFHLAKEIIVIDTFAFLYPPPPPHFPNTKHTSQIEIVVRTLKFKKSLFNLVQFKVAFRFQNREVNCFLKTLARSADSLQPCRVL